MKRTNDDTADSGRQAVISLLECERNGGALFCQLTLQRLRLITLNAAVCGSLTGL